jgi:hypothetical protein
MVETFFKTLKFELIWRAIVQTRTRQVAIVLTPDCRAFRVRTQGN